MFKKIVFSLLVVLGLAGISNADICKNISEVDYYFSPKGGATAAVVQEINNATVSIKVQAYSFTSKPIIDALINAKKRNVDIIVIVDKSQKNGLGSGYPMVKEAGITAFVDDKHQIAHNKIMIIDNKIVIIGSFNFTKNAEENNAENLAIIRDTCTVTTYINNFEIHKKHSVQ